MGFSGQIFEKSSYIKLHIPSGRTDVTKRMVVFLKLPTHIKVK